MKERRTYVVHDGEAYDPKDIVVTGTSVSIRKLRAVREVRRTFMLSELPRDLRRLLEQCHEIHIRWATSRPYKVPPPFLSRVASGLHLLFTPLPGVDAELLCPTLQAAFGPIKCSSYRETFTAIPIHSTRFSTSSSLQYFHPLVSLESLVGHINDAFCAKLSGQSRVSCLQEAGQLLDADTLDIDYDAISGALLVNGVWSRPNKADGWEETIDSKQKGKQRTEIGVLMNEKPKDEGQISVSGHLAVPGEDKELKPTLFAFPSRHLPMDPDATYFVDLKQPTGLHPTLLLHLAPHSLELPAPGCALHTYLTLPSPFFIDRYPFSDPLFLASHKLNQLHSLSGEIDLEAPDWVIKKWGSSALLELALPDKKWFHVGHKPRHWTVSVPLHLRYLEPIDPAANGTKDTHGGHDQGAYRATPLPHPSVFWACPADISSAKMAVNPFDRVNLGYDGLFGDRTVFRHVRGVTDPSLEVSAVGFPNNHGLVSIVTVPVLDLRWEAWVRNGTAVVVGLGTLVVAWVLSGAIWRDRRGRVEGWKSKEVKEAKKRR